MGGVLCNDSDDDPPTYLVNDCAIDDYDIDKSLWVSKLPIT